MRGRAQGDDFWAWREAMLEVAEGLTPDGVRSAYEETYREMRAAGYKLRCEVLTFPGGMPGDIGMYLSW